MVLSSSGPRIHHRKDGHPRKDNEREKGPRLPADDV